MKGFKQLSPLWITRALDLMNKSIQRSSKEEDKSAATFKAITVKYPAAEPSTRASQCQFYSGCGEKIEGHDLRNIPPHQIEFTVDPMPRSHAAAPKWGRQTHREQLWGCARLRNNNKTPRGLRTFVHSLDTLLGTIAEKMINWKKTHTRPSDFCSLPGHFIRTIMNTYIHLKIKIFFSK